MSGAERHTAAVIVNYRTAPLALAAAESVLAEDDLAEVVVVDNASGDASAAVLRQALADPRARVVEAPANGGFGAGVNLGAAACRSPLLLVLNSDATVAPGSLGLLVDALLADASLAALAPAVVQEPDGRSQPDAFGRLPRRWELLLPGPGRWTGGGDPLRPGWVSGVAMLVRAGDFRAAGGFDEGFRMYFEDVDLCRRLRAAGREVGRLPGATVAHAAGASWRSAGQRKRAFYRSKARYAQALGATRLEMGAIALVGRIRSRAPGPG